MLSRRQTSNGNCSWQWQDENGCWKLYSRPSCMQLEKARTSGGTHVELSEAGHKYRVDVKKMEQINIKTKVARKVQRTCNGRAGTAASDMSLTAAECTSNDTTSTAQNGNSRTAGRSSKRAATAEADAVVVKRAQNGNSLTAGRSSKRAATAEVDAVVVKRAKLDKTKSSAADAATNGTVKTLVVKGRAPVDPECYTANCMHVYAEGSDIYDVMLNQTDVGNNNNKYYIIQLLESDTKREFNVWNHWGRVGFKGQSSLLPCHSDLNKAKQLFCQKFVDKTRNDWSARRNFVKYPGKYDLVEIDYSAQGPAETEKKEKQTPKIPESKLNERLQELIKMICDVKAMENVVMEMKYDANRAPLGRLTKEQIKAGYSALQRIASCVDKAVFGPQLTAACNDFYTRIPHYFGMSRPPVIRTKAEVTAKLSLLEALGDIEIAMRVLKDCGVTENPVDSHYKALNCELRLMDRTDPMFKMIEDYLLNTHAPTHTLYKIKLLDVFEVERTVEMQNFVDYGNRMLLWHGSRLTNMVGILSSGLRVAPPEAPVTGYMFGKGIYFADMSSKSANYCYATRTKNVGLVLLSEVTLGKCHELLDANADAHKLPSGYHSVKGLGKLAPNSADNRILSDGTVVPLGKPHDTGVTNPAGYTLNYNEFVVYDPRQIKMRYALQVRFDF